MTTAELAPVTPADVLAPLSIKDTVLAQFKEAEASLVTMADRYRNVAYDVSTTKGMKEAIAARADLRDNGRLLITRAQKRVKDEVNDLKKVMSDEADRLVAIVKPVEDAVDAQIKAEEQRKADEKAKREQDEAERKAKHRDNLAKLDSYVNRAVGQPIDAIERAISVLEGLELGADWEEFLEAAQAARANTIAGLKQLIESERQRQENERLSNELAAAKAELEAAKANAAPAVAPAPAPEPTPEPEPASDPVASDLDRNGRDSLSTRFPGNAAFAGLAEASAQPAAPAAPVAEPTQAPAQAQRSILDLSDDEFKLLITSGGTLTIGQINKRLAKMEVDASKIADMGIATRKERGAVHIHAADFKTLRLSMIAHLQTLAD